MKIAVFALIEWLAFARNQSGTEMGIELSARQIGNAQIPEKKACRVSLFQFYVPLLLTGHVMVDGKYDVAIKRTAEGLIVDVYPDGWIDPIDTLAVWDDDVPAPTCDAA